MVLVGSLVGRLTPVPLPDAALARKVCVPSGAATVTAPVVRLRVPPRWASAAAFATRTATAAPMPDPVSRTCVASAVVGASVELSAVTVTVPVAGVLREKLPLVGAMEAVDVVVTVDMANAAATAIGLSAVCRAVR